MAFITAQEVKERRNEIKKQFPAKDGWKIRVNKNAHSSTIRVIVLAGPVDLTNLKSERDYWSIVTPNHIDNDYSEEAQEVLNKMYGIANKGNYDNSDVMTDYFDVGFYCHLKIGEYGTPYQVN